MGSLQPYQVMWLLWWAFRCGVSVGSPKLVDLMMQAPPMQVSVVFVGDCRFTTLVCVACTEMNDRAALIASVVCFFFVLSFWQTTHMHTTVRRLLSAATDVECLSPAVLTRRPTTAIPHFICAGACMAVGTGGSRDADSRQQQLSPF